MVWKIVAEEHSLEVPDPEEVLVASVLNHLEAVVMSGFGWIFALYSERACMSNQNWI
jgi:hypothetical protein